MNMLTELEDKLVCAWGQVVCIYPRVEYKREDLLESLMEEIKNSEQECNRETFMTLYDILKGKIALYRSGMHRWKSCKNLYDAFVVFINSDYEKYGLFELRKAREYFDLATPLYCKLSNSKPPVIRDKKGKTAKATKERSIIARLKEDIPDMRLFVTEDFYTQVLQNRFERLDIGRKGNYLLQLTLNSIGQYGVLIDGTPYKVILLNEKTKKELKVINYSDIKAKLRR